MTALVVVIAAVSAVIRAAPSVLVPRVSVVAIAAKVSIDSNAESVENTTQGTAVSPERFANIAV